MESSGFSLEGFRQFFICDMELLIIYLLFLLELYSKRPYFVYENIVMKRLGGRKNF